jgi:hypothetical protein
MMDRPMFLGVQFGGVGINSNREWYHKADRAVTRALHPPNWATVAAAIPQVPYGTPIGRSRRT